MYTLLVIIIVLVSILMIGIVLIQESKGGGLASNFSSSNQIMGVRKTTDFIEKATWGLAIAMVVISIACAYVAPQSTVDQSVMEQSSTTTNTAMPAMPGQNGAAQAPAQGAQAPVQGGAAQGAQAPAQSAPAAPQTPAK